MTIAAGSIFKYRYVANRRVSFENMDGYRWQYVEAPPALTAQMAGCPASKHEHGVIATDRMLLQKTLDRAELEPLA